MRLAFLTLSPPRPKKGLIKILCALGMKQLWPPIQASRGGKKWEAQTGSFQVILFRILCLFSESINTIQNNVKMATTFSPLLPPTWGQSSGPFNSGILQIWSSKWGWVTLWPLAASEEARSWGGGEPLGFGGWLGYGDGLVFLGEETAPGARACPKEKGV